MKLRRRHKEHAEVSTESLNDIMFFLLLFFLIVSTLVNPNVLQLVLPSYKNPSPETQVNPVTVSVTKDLQFAVNSQIVSADQLESVLTSEIQKSGQQRVLLQVDKEVKIQDVLTIMEIGDKLKIKMVLSTKAA